VEQQPDGLAALLERQRFTPHHPGLLRPSYDGHGIANLPWTLLRALGLPMEGTPLSPELVPPALLDGVRSVLLVVVDALGYLQLSRAMAAGDAPTISALAERGAFFPLTSTFPSTTVAALTTLQTGYPPARHGLVGYTCYLREFGMLTNLIRLAPVGAFPSFAAFGFEPRRLLPAPTIYERAIEGGLAAAMVNHRDYERSPLSRLHAEGIPYHAYTHLGDFATTTRSAALARGPHLTVAYWPALDLIGHQYGPQSEPALAELRALDAALGRELVGRLQRDDLLVVLTADHGQVQLDPDAVQGLNRHRDLLAWLRVPPAGERRAGYFYPLPGAEEAVLAALIDLAGERAVLSRGHALLEGGLLGEGPFDPEVTHRVGEVVLMATGRASFPFTPTWESAVAMRGAHGSLEAEEMLVPCLVWRP